MTALSARSNQKWWALIKWWKNAAVFAPAFVSLSKMKNVSKSTAFLIWLNKINPAWKRKRKINSNNENEMHVRNCWIAKVTSKTGFLWITFGKAGLLAVVRETVCTFVRRVSYSSHIRTLNHKFYDHYKTWYLKFFVNKWNT